jgi:hypothetical protein
MFTVGSTLRRKLPMSPILSKPMSNFHPEQHLRLLDERKEPYHDYSAIEVEARCAACGAVHKNVAWHWIEPSVDAVETRCPACKRIAERAPASYLEIEGTFLNEKRAELINAIRALERVEKSADPLQRIMAIESSEKGILVTTTDVRLARAIAQLLQTSFQCDLDFHYDRDRSILWLRCCA